MSLKTDWVAIQFIRYTNRVGLSTRTAIGEFDNKGLPEINLNVREVDYDNEKEVCRQYGVYGIPVILVFWKDRIIGRHYGERTTDEFGSAIGMITMEDILEEVVGEIDVGLDFEEYLPRRKRRFEKLNEEVYLMDSRFPISEANEVLGTALPATESHTIGGLVMARLRHIPKEGEFIEEAGCRFTVEQATERSVVKLRVERIGI